MRSIGIASDDDERAPQPSTGPTSTGSGNVIVQILGHENRVDLGRPYLKLTRYLTRRRVDSEADLLSPHTRSIPLVGRGPEVAELRRKVERDARFAGRRTRSARGPRPPGPSRATPEGCAS